MYSRRTYEPLKFLGRLMFVPLSVNPRTRPISVTTTWEDSGDFRWAPTLVLRLPLSYYAFGFGVWLDSRPEDQIVVTEDEIANADYAAFEAVNGPTDREKYDIVRAQIASQGLDPGEEMELMQMLNVMDPEVVE